MRTITPKNWNYIAILIIAGLYWIIGSEYGDFFKLTGCIFYIASAILWIKKSTWGQWLIENIFDVTPLEDEK